MILCDFRQQKMAFKKQRYDPLFAEFGKVLRQKTPFFSPKIFKKIFQRSLITFWR
jgi:hypothetical protein